MTEMTARGLTPDELTAAVDVHGLVRRGCGFRPAPCQARASMVEVADAGHDVHLDAPAQVADLISAFVNGSHR